MRLTGILAVAAAIAMPAAVQAEAIPQNIVGEYVDACVSSCASNDNGRDCSEFCGCVGDRMSEQWSKEDYDRYSTAYAANPDDAEVRGKVDGLVQQCAGAL